MDLYNLFKLTERTGFGYFLWPDLPDNVIELKSPNTNNTEDSLFLLIDEKRRISKFLEKLTFSEKLVIYLKAIGYEYKEISEIMGLPDSQILAMRRRIARKR